MKSSLIPRPWSINGRFLVRDPTGVDRYAREIIEAIDGLVRENHPLAAGLQLEILSPASDNSAKTLGDIPIRQIRRAPGHFWEQFILPRYVRGGLLSLCNTGPVSVKKQIVCIHDLSSRLAPDSYGVAFRTAYRVLLPSLGRRAAHIATVSHFSQQMLTKYRVAPSDKIEVIHDGYEHVLKWKADRSSLHSVELPERFVFLVGSKAPHKNTAIIYSIAPELAARGIDVLITGGHDKNVYAQTRDGELPPNVRHLGRLGDDDLAFLYQRALCLVLPSRTEGFGLPALEAMALGCPVVSTNAASLPEVCGEAALYASPDDPGAWLGAIERIAADPLLQRKLVAAGLGQSKAFSWREGAKKYLELMNFLDHDANT
jgi:glycosyltransferase involved in cell wall biosynthesis